MNTNTTDKKESTLNTGLFNVAMTAVIVSSIVTTLYLIKAMSILNSIRK